MTDEDWERPDTRALTVFLDGREITDQDPDGNTIAGGSFLLLINAHHQPVAFTLPTPSRGTGWAMELSTADPDVRDPQPLSSGEIVEVEAPSIHVLRRR